MAIYAITGKLGSGKTLAAVGRIRDYLARGAIVASNLDIFVEGLTSAQSRKTLIRLPDKPTISDLQLIGKGNDTPDETKNGLIVLDELGAWFNARSWADKSRQAVIDWLIHSRKLGWDIIFIVQNVKMLDSQARDSLIEMHGTCRRLDRLRIPVVGHLFAFMGLKVNPPKVHICTIKYGIDKDALVVDRWMYRATELYGAYDTRQIFSDSYSHGVFSYLSAWHIKGRHLPPKTSLLQRFNSWLNHHPKKPIETAKNPLIERLMRLPPDKRTHFVNRYIKLGLL